VFYARLPPQANVLSAKETTMKKALLFFVFTIAFSSSVYAQEKGVDAQNDRIRDNGNRREPAINGRKQDTGVGRGIDFGRGRTPAITQLANPYKFTLRRDAVMQAVEELIRERQMLVDSTASRAGEGVFVTQPFTFIKGAVVAASEINRYAELPPATARGWTRGRYSLTVEVQPVDGTNTNVSVNARVEGRTDGASGAEWTTLPSTGIAEQEFLVALVEKLTGSSPMETDQ
jgi:hypothetical protein